MRDAEPREGVSGEIIFLVLQPLNAVFFGVYFFSDWQGGSFKLRLGTRCLGICSSFHER